MIAFGGLSWALDGAAAPAAAVVRLKERWAPAGAWSREPERPRHAGPRDPFSQRHVRVSNDGRTGARRLRPDDPSRVRRWRSSARTARARRRSPSCCAGFTTPRKARSKSTASTCAHSTWTPGGRGWRRFFKTLSALSARSATTWRRPGADDALILAVLAEAGAAGLAELDTVLARGYAGGTELSGGQWQRIALARALCAVRTGPASCSSTSRPPSSMSVARPRSSIESSQPRGTRRRS